MVQHRAPPSSWWERPGGQRGPRQDGVAKADVGPAHMVALMFPRGPPGALRFWDPSEFHGPGLQVPPWGLPTAADICRAFAAGAFPGGALH